MAFFLTDDLNQQDKLEELGKIRDAINALGGKIEPLGDKPAEIAKEVSKIIKQFDILWEKSVSDIDAHPVLARLSIFICLVLEFSDDGKAPDGNITDCSNLIEQFCDKMREGEAAGKGRVSTRILYDMFQMNFPSTSKAKYIIFCAWLNCCSKKNATYLLELQKSKIDKFVEKWQKDWEMNDTEVRVLRRSYQYALQRLERYEEAATAMEFLLESHPDVKSEEAIKDASNCIIQGLTTPSQFRFDHLKEIDAVLNLAETEFGQLLEIFIRGTAEEFNKFKEGSKLSELGFTDDQIKILEEKMKLLTLVHLACQTPDVLYRTVEAKLNLDEEDCEDLAVKAFQLKLLRGRLDQGNERISTTYAIKREFGPEDWKNLKNKLDLWQQNLEQVKVNVEQVEQLAAN